MTILTLNGAKEWLRVDGTHEDDTITLLIGAAETYLKNATGKDFDGSNSLAKLYCMVLVADWFENRELIGSQPSNKMRLTIRSITTQLQYCETEPAGGGTNP